MAPAAKPHGHLSTLPAPSHSQGHMTARESSLLAPGGHLETITSTPIDCCLLLRHCVGQPSPRQSSGPLRTLPLSSWAPLSVRVAWPHPSRTRGPNVLRGRSGLWGKSLTLRARWPGFTSWLLLCDLEQVTSLLSFPIRSHGEDETSSCLGAAPGFCIRPNRDGI